MDKIKNILYQLSIAPLIFYILLMIVVYSKSIVLGIIGTLLLIGSVLLEIQNDR